MKRTKNSAAKTGRPRQHDRKALCAVICERVGAGELVKDVCAELGVTPAMVRKWAADDEEFGALYARAREDQAHSLAEQAIGIANGTDPLTKAREEAIEKAADSMSLTEPDWKQKIRALENALIQRDKLRVDTLKWFASKLAPKLYGDKQQVEHTGKDGQPIQHEHKVIKWGNMEIPV